MTAEVRVKVKKFFARLGFESGAGHLARGRRAERRARRYLERRGLSTVARNFRCRSGELDLIMRERKKHDAQLVFVEVRYRNSNDFARPEETVTGAKQARIRSCAGFFLSRYRRFRKWPFRFDIVALSGAWPRREVRWIQNAF